MFLFHDAVLSLLTKINIMEKSSWWSKAEEKSGEGRRKRRRGPRLHNPLQGPPANYIASFPYVLLPEISTNLPKAQAENHVSH